MPVVNCPDEALLLCYKALRVTSLCLPRHFFVSLSWNNSAIIKLPAFIGMYMNNFGVDDSVKNRSAYFAAVVTRLIEGIGAPLHQLRRLSHWSLWVGHTGFILFAIIQHRTTGKWPPLTKLGLRNSNQFISNSVLFKLVTSSVVVRDSQTRLFSYYRLHHDFHSHCTNFSVCVSEFPIWKIGRLFYRPKWQKMVRTLATCNSMLSY